MTDSMSNPAAAAAPTVQTLFGPRMTLIRGAVRRTIKHVLIEMRKERFDDILTVRGVNNRAFEQDQEARRSTPVWTSR